MTTHPTPPAQNRWLWPLLLVLGTLAGATIPELFARGYYHYDDNMHLFLPTFYEIGTQLRMGNMPWISDRSWLGGNFIGEGQFALFNPFSLALYAWMSTQPETAVSAIVFATFHLLVLASGAYLLVLHFGGKPAYAAVAGVACANTSIVSYWYAAAWWNALVADAWLVVALAFWAKFLLQGRGLLPAVLFGALSMVSGWPHGWIALALFITIFAYVAWRTGEPHRALAILGGGVATLLLALPAIMPVIDYALMSERRSRLLSSGSMIGTLESLLSLSWPAYLPQVHRIYGWIAEAPLTFAAWFVAPVALVCRQCLWKRRHEPGMAFLLIAAFVFVLLSMGPEQFFFLRWPMRFITYFQMLLIIMAALLLSQPEKSVAFVEGGALLATYGGLMAYLGLASEPSEFGRQVVLSLLGILLLFGLARHAKHANPTPTAMYLLGTTLLLVACIHGVWPRHPNVPDWQGPRVVQTDRMDVPHFSGNTLVLHRLSERKHGNDADPLAAALNTNTLTPSGAMALWSIPYAINGYSALPHAGLRRALCFSGPWGHSCANVLETVFATPAGLPLRRDELLDLTEIRIAKGHVPSGSFDWPREWRLSEETATTLIYRRDPRPRPPGSAAWADDGLHLRIDAPATPASESLWVENTSDQPRRIIFSRMSYPGFSATFLDKPLRLEVADGMLIAATIPPGANGRLALGYRPPLFAATGPLALLGLLLAATLAWRYRFRVGIASIR